ncbi:hypothetical protein QBC34DRAFT_403935 [Podospora aff. communis PSN243]|uniref:Actin cortical patch SUR7/pH-response regulator PalI n=1 Tax=Podospora aff. communis PSN243 TaxID=3040156 RepID=A0AAV9GLR1_9PEZI|nr:hypothetical protein QBC34DRAFT_403935 [Podospora aff. communis PSN243]
MKKFFSWSVLLVPVVIVFNVGMLAVEVIMVRAGTGSLNADKLPSYSGWYAVMIDADEYKFSTNDPGLPDWGDISKPKDFFAIYPSLYCSGQKKTGSKDGRGKQDVKYEADYCSPWGYQFDLQWLWRDWGVDIVKDIGQNPRMIWITLITSILSTALSATLKLLGLCFFYAKVASCIVSWVSVICTCALGTTSQTFVGNLVGSLPGLRTGGTGQLSAQSGPFHIKVAWILAAVSFVSALVETFVVYREYQVRRARSSSPSGRGRNNAAGGAQGGVYQHLGAGGKEGLHAGSHIELIQSSLRTPSPMRGGKTVSVTVQDTAYEPMRHREFV